MLKLHLKRHYFWPACVTACVPSAVPVRGFMGRSLCAGTRGLHTRVLPQNAKLLLLINVLSLGKSWVETVCLVSLQLLYGLYPFFLVLFFSLKPPFFSRSELVRGPDSQLHGGGPRSAPADTRARTHAAARALLPSDFYSERLIWEKGARGEAE